MKLRVLGRVIGTCDDWDQGDTESFSFYNFKPAESVDLPSTDCLNIEYGSGLFSTYADNGDGPESTWDIIETLKHLPKP